MHTPFQQGLKEAEEIKANSSHAKTFPILLKVSHRVGTEKRTQSIVNYLYQTNVQLISNTSRNKWINLTAIKKGTDNENRWFNFSSAPWKYFIFLIVYAKERRGSTWHLSLLQEAYILIHIHACKVEYLCIQEQSWLEYQVCSRCFGCTLNKISYQIPWSFFAQKRGTKHSPAPEEQMAFERYLAHSYSNAIALLSFLTTFPNGKTMSVLLSSVF